MERSQAKEQRLAMTGRRAGECEPEGGFALQRVARELLRPFASEPPFTYLKEGVLNQDESDSRDKHRCRDGEQETDVKGWRRVAKGPDQRWNDDLARTDVVGPLDAIAVLVADFNPVQNKPGVGVG